MIECFVPEQVKSLAAYCAKGTSEVYARHVLNYVSITAIGAGDNEGAMSIQHIYWMDTDKAFEEGARIARILSDQLMATMIAEGAWQP